MFGKLLKYEFRSMSRILLPVLLGALVVCGVGGPLLTLALRETTDLIDMLLILLMMLLSFLCTACVILTYILGFIRFRSSMYGPRAYLTHTLPVTLHQLLLSKVLVLWVFMGASFLVTMLNLVSFFLSFSIIDGDYLFIQDVLREMGRYLPGMLVNALFYPLLAALVPVFAVCAGHSLPKAKLGVSIVLAIAIPYLGYNLVYVLFVVLAVLFAAVPEQLQWLADLIGNPYLLSSVALVTQLGLIALFYFLSHLLLKKKLNLN